MTVLRDMSTHVPGFACLSDDLCVAFCCGLCPCHDPHGLTCHGMHDDLDVHLSAGVQPRFAPFDCALSSTTFRNGTLDSCSQDLKPSLPGSVEYGSHGSSVHWSDYDRH
jgi:hypothetical protein